MFVILKRLSKVFIVGNISVCRKLSTWYQHVFQIWLTGLYLVVRHCTNCTYL
jgi:hypothetical protein